MTIRNIISEAFRRGKANKPDPFYQKMSDDAYEGAVKMHITMNSGPEYKGVTFTDKNRETMRKHRDAGAHPSKAFSAMMNEETDDIHELSKATLRRYTDDAVWDGADHLHKARMKDRVADREDVNPMTRSIAKQEKAKHQKKVKNRVVGVQKAKEKLDESAQDIHELSTHMLQRYYNKAKRERTSKAMELFNPRATKAMVKDAVHDRAVYHRRGAGMKMAEKAYEKKTVSEATLGGPKYIGTENPNNRKSRMPGVFSPFKRAANQARAEVAFNKHAVAATKAFVQRNMATLAKTTSAYAKRTKRHEQAMTAAEKVAPRDITKRGELMYEGEDIHEVSTKLVGRYLKKAVPHLMKNERHAADAYNQSGSQHEYFENKVTKRLKGIDRASRKLANEETEINEISKDLAARYVGDTSHDIVWNAMRATKHNMERDNAKVGKPSKEKELDAKYHDNEMKYHSRKVKNRQTGIDRALRRLKKD